MLKRGHHAFKITSIIIVTSLSLLLTEPAFSHPLITSLVETGGNTNYPARFTGETFNHTSGLGVITVGLFGEDVPAYTDRVHQWNGYTNFSGTVLGLPSYLVGGEYIMAGNDRRGSNNYSLTITVSQPAYAYVFVDNKGSPLDADDNDPPDIGAGTNNMGRPFMQWLLDGGFTAVRTGLNRSGDSNLPDEIGQDASGNGVGPGVSIDSHSSVYAKQVSGTFVLGEMAAGSGGRAMYGVVVSTNAPPTIPSVTLIASVVEAGGDGSTTVPARFTGQTFTNTAGYGIITVGLFDEDVLATSDRGHQWNSVTNSAGVAIGMPSYLVNGEYIVPGTDRRDNQFYSLTVTLSRPAYVYLLIDNRGSVTNGHANTPPDIGTGTNSLGLPFMNWVLTKGFAPVRTARNRAGNPANPDEIGMDETPNLGIGPGVEVNSYMSVYGRKFSGTFVLGEYAAGGGGRAMYGVVVSTNPPPPVIKEITADSQGNATLNFYTIPGGTYRIEYKDSLGDAQWTALSTNQVAVGSVATLPDNAGAQSHRFYRAVLLP